MTSHNYQSGTNESHQLRPFHFSLSHVRLIKTADTFFASIRFFCVHKFSIHLKKLVLKLN